MNIRKLLPALLLTAILPITAMTIGCSTAPTAEKAREEAGQKAYFDEALVRTLMPGTSTREDVRNTLGEPYPDPLKSPSRWTYMYTLKKQLVVSFEDGVVDSLFWSEEYGI